MRHTVTPARTVTRERHPSVTVTMAVTVTSDSWSVTLSATQPTGSRCGSDGAAGAGGKTAVREAQGRPVAVRDHARAVRGRAPVIMKEGETMIVCGGGDHARA